MKDEIAEVLKKLISIDSSNAFLVPGSPGESEILRYIKGYLEELGLNASLEDTGDGHENLFATIPGTGKGKPVTLCAHTDTVGYAQWRDRALKAVVSGHRLTGLGACDDKGHCAAMMLVAKALAGRKKRLPGDVHLAFVADEEGESRGSLAYVKAHSPEAVLILEPAPLHRIKVSHQGFGWLNIKVKGQSACGSAAGTADAIARMGEVIVRLQRNQREVFAKNQHPLNGETVYHTGMVRGGSDFATYPDFCELGIEIGIQPGETIEKRIQEINEIFEEVEAMYPDFEGSVEIVVARGPFETKGAEDLYRALSEEVEKELGVEAEAAGENSWGDAQIFQDAGFPALGIGAVGGNLHAPDEWVSLPQLERLMNVLVETLKRYCMNVTEM
ncbi:MAG: M20/M25/M40 family metallo-hydrolase [Clostridiales bacterium]|nr:M20/M25/M40 family metallo-hydrolase [Clostridiales bacterium]